MAKRATQQRNPARGRRQGAPSEAVKQTKKQIALGRKQARQNRIVWLSVAGFGVIILALVIAMVVKQLGVKPPAVATVDGTQIRENDFSALVKLYSNNLQSSIDAYQSQLSALDSTDPNISLYTQLYQQQISQLQTELANVDGLALDTLVDDTLIEEKARESKISVSTDEVAQAIDDMKRPPTPTPQPTSTLTTTIPTATPIPQEQIEASYQAYLQNLGISERDFRNIVRRELLRNKVQELLASQVLTSGLVANIQLIQADTEDAAAAAEQRVNSGEDFAAVAKEVSTDTTTKDLGGSLDWVTPDQVSERYGAEVGTLAFSLKAGEMGRATGNGKYFVVRVIDRNENGPLPQTVIDEAKQNALAAWLTQRRAEATIQQFVLTSTPIPTFTPLPSPTQSQALPTQTPPAPSATP